MHRDDCARIDELDRIGRTLRPHREMIPNANQHDVDLLVTRNQRHIGK